MSLIITVCTSEGIVMASDSRSTYNKTETNGTSKTIKFGVHFTDTTYKTFLCDDRIGISTCGNGTICGMSIASHIESYINNEYKQTDSVKETASKVLDFFSKLPHSEPVIFHIAGYEKEDSKDVFRMYRIVTLANSNVLSINNICGAKWDGETEIVTRIIKNGYIVSENEVVKPTKLTITTSDEQGNEKEENLTDHIVIPKTALRHPELDIAWGLLTLQDGIEFAEYAIKTTIDTMRFQIAPKTVGNPIDILVIKPDGAKWIKRKELHA